MADFTDEVRGRLERLLNDRVLSARSVPGGHTPAGRWLLALASGKSVFAKLGATELTASALRLEQEVYAELNAPFMPCMIAWQDHSEHPLLVLEDLSSARWPPPWDSELVVEVRATLESVHHSRANLRAISDLHGSFTNHWEVVAQNPQPFLNIGLVSDEWLQRALPKLLEASSRLAVDGSDVLHLDVRSDNLCKTTRGIVFIDWNWACIGNGALDLGFWLPSLEAEGGPKPEELLPAHPEVAACVSGYFAAKAGLPPIPDAPRVRHVQLQQLKPALRWVSRALELPTPDLPA